MKQGVQESGIGIVKLILEDDIGECFRDFGILVWIRESDFVFVSRTLTNVLIFRQDFVIVSFDVFYYYTDFFSFIIGWLFNYQLCLFINWIKLWRIISRFYYIFDIHVIASYNKMNPIVDRNEPIVHKRCPFSQTILITGYTGYKSACAWLVTD